MKWRLIIFDAGRKAALECYDAGVLSENKLCSWCDNYPYVSGTLRLDGILAHLNAKLSVINAHGAIPLKICWDEAWKTPLRASLPKELPVVSLDVTQERIRNGEDDINVEKTITLETIDARFRKVEMFISDPRILFLSYTAQLDYDKGLWKQIRASLPSYQQAKKCLEDAALWSPFSPQLCVNERFYDQLPRFLDQFVFRHCPVLNEIATAVEKAAPEIPQKWVRIAGTFAISDKSLLEKIQVGMPVIFKREPKNPYDKYAIRIDINTNGWWASYSPHQKLGYIPKALAKELAAWMDAGNVLHGIIAAVDGMNIDIEIVCRKRVENVDTLTIQWGEKTRRWQEATIVAAERKVYYWRREHYFSGECLKMELSFSVERWKRFIAPLLQICAFPEWKPVYREIDADCKNFFWKMTAQQKETIYHSCGCDRTPLEWVYWCSLIEGCLDLENPIGIGTYTIK